MDNDVESESKKERAIRYETRFVLVSTPTLGAISIVFFVWTDLPIWFWLIPALGCVCGILYLLWNTRFGKVILGAWEVADVLYHIWLGICALVDLAGWIIGAIGALVAIGLIR